MEGNAAEILPEKWAPETFEEEIYQRWVNDGCFRSVPDERQPYVILMPPPNVTGVLHMGHMLNNTIQDVLIRRARMLGYNACWVPGTDHASIATEARVVRMLREKGIQKTDLSRDEFLQYAWDWKNKYGGIILEQLKKLGASCDWERTRFTMDEGYYRAVIRVFVDLYRKGYIYRGKRMINWDCEARTALSNEEVIYHEPGEESTLYYVRYPLADGSGYLRVATQRPETIPGDVAVAVNPQDSRYVELMGKKVVVPLVHRVVEVIADSYVDPDFGTGCLKVTPAHDVNDYEIGLRHGLPIIDILNEDGTLNEACGVKELIGLDRFEARKKAVEMLREAGLLEKEEKVLSRIGRSERTGSVVEPRLSEQWFLRMDKLAGPALQAVESGEVKLHPSKFVNTYRHWMENVRDWCISRQLWWGHRIPAWYLKNDRSRWQVAENAEEALALFRAQNPGISSDDIEQDPDVLDTWASSWLWPIAVFEGFDYYDLAQKRFNTIPRDLQYYYPTTVLVTAPEILFFWVARMIMAGCEYMKQAPFKDVYLTGIVRDKLGRKMSKSLGNSPEPLDLMARYGADGVRMGMLLCSPAGNDLLFDESLCQQGRNFCNKLWNAFRLVKSWTAHPEALRSEAAKEAEIWFGHCLNNTLHQLRQQFDQYRLNEALMSVYRLMWDHFCSVYLEAIKPTGRIQNPQTLHQAWCFMEILLRLAHPFVPFTTEKLYEYVPAEYKHHPKHLMLAPWPEAGTYDENVLHQFDSMLEVAAALRQFRTEQKIPFRQALQVFSDSDIPFRACLMKLCNVQQWAPADQRPDSSRPLVVGVFQLYVPVERNAHSAEALKLREELEYVKGFLELVNKKLSNERFVANAPPDLVERERKKKADAEARIRVLEDLLRRELSSSL
ncbi:MAG: valine--tRNA ligase [Flavobacteriales bacterium]|nr:valine--tRNA ligase [Flavobacteriales bacterium]MCX7768771.1 valine--tRNA ligase [Flavobacteriales bacterium]MDW8409435.1 valine--tRNA ligase [Flavobacteriales bacterium]